MPGREPPTRTAASANSFARGAHSISSNGRNNPTSGPYSRRGADPSSAAGSHPSSSHSLARPVGSSATTTARRARLHALTSRSNTTSPPPQVPEVVPTPACATCVACYRATEDVLAATAAVLANAKRLLMDDALHHYRGDEAWLRLLRSLGWAEKDLNAST